MHKVTPNTYSCAFVYSQTDSMHRRQCHCAPCVGVSIFPYLLFTSVCCLMPHISTSHRQSLSPSSLLSLLNVTFFSVNFMFAVKSLLLSPCCLHVLEDKVTHLVSLLCRCDYTINLVYRSVSGERSERAAL